MQDKFEPRKNNRNSLFDPVSNKDRFIMSPRAKRESQSIREMQLNNGLNFLTVNKDFKHRYIDAFFNSHNDFQPGVIKNAVNSNITSRVHNPSIQQTYLDPKKLEWIHAFSISDLTSNNSYNPLCMASEGDIYLSLNPTLVKIKYRRDSVVAEPTEKEKCKSFATEVLFKYDANYSITSMCNTTAGLVCAATRGNGDSDLSLIDKSTGNEINAINANNSTIVSMIPQAENQLFGIIQEGDLIELNTNQFNNNNLLVHHYETTIINGIDYYPTNSLLSIGVDIIKDNAHNYSIRMLDPRKINDGHVFMIPSPVPLSKAMAFSPNGRYLIYATKGNEQNLRIWSLKDESDIATSTLPGNITNVHWINDNTIATFSGNSKQSTISHWSFVPLDHKVYFKLESSKSEEKQQPICSVQNPEDSGDIITLHHNELQEDNSTVNFYFLGDPKKTQIPLRYTTYIDEAGINDVTTINLTTPELTEEETRLMHLFETGTESETKTEAARRLSFFSPKNTKSLSTTSNNHSFFSPTPSPSVPTLSDLLNTTSNSNNECLNTPKYDALLFSPRSSIIKRTSVLSPTNSNNSFAEELFFSPNS